MALSVTTPTYAFTNQFPPITIMGTAKEKLLISINMGGRSVLENETYYFDTDGIATLRFIGDLLEKYFYDENYDIHYFSLNAVFTFVSSGQTVTKTVPVYFCRGYVSGDKLTPDMVRTMPLTRAQLKHTLPDAKEYLSFVSTSGQSVTCDICFNSEGTIKQKAVNLYNFPSTDTYSTVDVSYSMITTFLSASDIPLYWDVYKSTNKERKIRYWLDKAGSFPSTTFIYQNAFGGIESFVCRGIRKDEIKAERETGTLLGRTFITKQTALRCFTINTGTLDEEQKEALISLLTSMSLMVLKDGIAIPIIVDGENVSLHNYRSKLPTADFTYSYSERNLTIYKYNKDKGIFDYTFDYTFE